MYGVGFAFVVPNFVLKKFYFFVVVFRMFVEISQSMDDSFSSVRCWGWIWKNEDVKTSCVICESMNYLIVNESMRHFFLYEQNLSLNCNTSFFVK